MITQKEYDELVNALIEDGINEETAHKIIQRSEKEGLLDPPDFDPFLTLLSSHK